MATPSWQDIYDLGRYVLQARRPTLVVTRGDVTDAVLAGGATMADVAIGEAATQTRATFLDGAADELLTGTARDRGVERDTGDKSIGTALLARPTTGGGAGTIPIGTRIATQPDDQGRFASYTLDAAAVFSAGDLSQSVTFTCTVVGPEGDAIPGAVDRFIDSIFDTTITVTNPQRCVGGSNAESDPDLRDRTRGFFLTQARGTDAAIIFGAKDDVRTVKRASLLVSLDTGIGTLYVADANGNSNDAMVSAVTAILPRWKAFDSIVNVVGADLLLTPIDISLTLAAGTDQAAIINTIRTSIVSALQKLEPGAILFRDLIRMAAKDVDRARVFECRVNNPPANIVPGAGQAIRTTIDLITTS